MDSGKSRIMVEEGLLARVTSCLAKQKYIHEDFGTPEYAEFLETVDAAYQECMALLENKLSRETKKRGKEANKHKNQLNLYAEELSHGSQTEVQ